MNARRTVHLLSVLCGAPVGVATAIAVLPLTARAQPTETPAVGVPHTVRPTIAVFALNQKGTGVAGSADQGEALTISMTEEALTQSHAFRLLSRDQMSRQAKEIKLDAEGWVDATSAQKFGKSAGIERFVTVFVSQASMKHYNDSSNGAKNYPTNGDIVPLALTGTPTSADNGASGNFWTRFSTALNQSRSANTSTNAQLGRDLVRATVGIMCRFTRVETGERTTLSYLGEATADGNRADEHRLEMVAAKNAFDNMALNLAKHRPPLLGNITEVADGKAIVDMGEQDGLSPGMAFEICEIKKIGSFTSYAHLCDARVSELNPTTALLDIGEYRKQFLSIVPAFHEKKDKAKLVHVGCIIREKPQI